MRKSLALLLCLLIPGPAAAFYWDAGTSTSFGSNGYGAFSAFAEAGADVGANVEVDVTIAETLDMSSGNFFFKPNTISAAPGQTVNVRVVSNDGYHTFVIEGVVNQTVRADGTISFTAPTTPGTYPFYCDVGTHQSLGMSGTLFVE